MWSDFISTIESVETEFHLILFRIQCSLFALVMRFIWFLFPIRCSQFASIYWESAMIYFVWFWLRFGFRALEMKVVLIHDYSISLGEFRAFHIRLLWALHIIPYLSPYVSPRSSKIDRFFPYQTINNRN